MSGDTSPGASVPASFHTWSAEARATYWEIEATELRSLLIVNELRATMTAEQRDLLLSLDTLLSDCGILRCNLLATRVSDDNPQSAERVTWFLWGEDNGDAEPQKVAR